MSAKLSNTDTNEYRHGARAATLSRLNKILRVIPAGNISVHPWSGVFKVQKARKL
jgi:hypothetical protein